jgi:hypothetical protein
MLAVVLYCLKLHQLQPKLVLIVNIEKGINAVVRLFNIVVSEKAIELIMVN